MIDKAKSIQCWSGQDCEALDILQQWECVSHLPDEVMECDGVQHALNAFQAAAQDLFNKVESACEDIVIQDRAVGELREALDVARIQAARCYKVYPGIEDKLMLIINEVC